MVAAVWFDFQVCGYFNVCAIYFSGVGEMKYTEAFKQILFNPHRIFRDQPSWGYISYNFYHGIRWIWRAIANILQYPFWIVVRTAFYLTAPLSAFLLIGAIKRDKKRREARHKEMPGDYYKNHRKLDDE